MDQSELFFFNERPQALPLYVAFHERLFTELERVSVKVQKTQITFSNRYGFAFVSFLPARRAKERPDPYITITLGLGHRLNSPRVDQASEPYPGRWTHHLVIRSVEEIDSELMGWVREAYDFAAVKTRKKEKRVIRCWLPLFESHRGICHSEAQPVSELSFEGTVAETE